MLVCFESELALQFQRIAHTVKELMNVQDARASLWSFIEFIIVNRSPLFILLQPFILQRVNSDVQTIVFRFRLTDLFFLVGIKERDGTRNQLTEFG